MFGLFRRGGLGLTLRSARSFAASANAGTPTWQGVANRLSPLPLQAVRKKLVGTWLEFVDDAARGAPLRRLSDSCYETEAMFYSHLGGRMMSNLPSEMKVPDLDYLMLEFSHAHWPIALSRPHLLHLLGIFLQVDTFFTHLNIIRNSLRTGVFENDVFGVYELRLTMYHLLNCHTHILGAAPQALDGANKPHLRFEPQGLLCRLYQKEIERARSLHSLKPEADPKRDVDFHYLSNTISVVTTLHTLAKRDTLLGLAKRPRTKDWQTLENTGITTSSPFIYLFHDTPREFWQSEAKTQVSSAKRALEETRVEPNSLTLSIDRTVSVKR